MAKVKTKHHIEVSELQKHVAMTIEYNADL